MAEMMTLEQVRDTLASWLGGSEACLDTRKVALLESMIAACDPHLAQPAQSVDVGAIRELVTEWASRSNRDSPGGGEYYSGKSDAYDTCADELEQALTHAIGNAQAEGWKDIATAPKDGASILICGGAYAVGLHSDLPLTQPVIAFWDRDHWHGPEANGHDLWWECSPTIWMPLPTPPTKATPNVHE
jgi:hypothetical protein